ncbi:MAG: cbb3-type cytochrome c oxidase subunit II, partial [Xanthomonadales bacterium]|nr:cbb3-type cytochrome c oxidase subunit II [Xanthomonadales bacterium]
QDEVFGRPSAPCDFAYQSPQLLGSEGSGPDLTNVGNAKPSDVWQYIHLYNPRAVVPASIMPNFKFLFQVTVNVPPGETAVPVPPGFAPSGGKVIPTQKAKALVAYLLSLKQPPLANAEAVAMPMPAQPAATPAPAPAATAIAAATASSPQGSASTAASGGYTYDAAKGKQLFTAHCAACHQANGEGIPSAFPSLKGNAAVDNADPSLHIHTVLHGAQGVTIGGVTYNSVMPPFAAQLDDTDIANIVNYERSSWGNHSKPVSAADVAAERKKSP